jgi:replicative DNA helicase Mcm
MAQAPSQELTDKFVSFYRNYYRTEIGRLAQRYPNEQRSLYVDYDDLYQFDPDLAEDYLAQPDQIQEYAEEALRLYDLPADVKLGQAHVRLRNVPSKVDIRNIRVHDDHVGRMVAVSGIVRKATDVRPKITEAAFECQRCGTMTYIPQSDTGFQEPHECQGCERQGPFRVNFDQSEFVDSQKLRVQESPEGLRGGETPQSIDVDIVDDLTGKVTPGDHVTVTGVLHIEQQTEGNEKSPIFDLYMDGVSLEIEDEEFEDMDITEEDKAEIVRLSNEPNLYERMVDSIAPNIYGYEEEKLAIILQLFSGVTKHLPDGSRIRGDLHMLLIGDPGTGKCCNGNETITLSDGSRRKLRSLVEENLSDPLPVDDGVWDAANIPIATITSDGSVGESRARKVWKREAPETMYRIETASGSTVEVTPSHPLFVQRGCSPTAVRAETLSEGEFLAVPRTLPTRGDDALATDERSATTDDVVPNLSGNLRRIREALALSQFDCGVPRTTYQHYERGDRNPSRDSLLTVVEAFEERVAWLRETRARIEAGDWSDIAAVRSELNRSQADVAAATTVTQEAISSYERNDAVPDGGTTAAARDAVIERIDEALAVAEDVRALRGLATNDLRWDPIESIETIEPEYDWVYDLEVEGTHTYLSNGIVSHNSQLLSYVQNIAPRSVYTSGKGSSSAGLTAAAVRSDFGDGDQWTLEAGALVLADKGIAAVDELDKMRCVTGETLVHTSDGIVPIRELARRAETDGDVERLPNGRTIRGDVATVRTLDDEGRLVTRPVTAVHEYDAPDELYEVELESGASVTATADHPFFVAEGGERLERGAATLDPGDRVYVPGDRGMIADGGMRAAQTGADVGGEVSRDADITLESVASVTRVAADEGASVYDLTVEGTHNFVANGMVVHNSEDRSAMHEALEQQSVSIAKAGINATLKSRCSLLGAANPKYGRFDEYEPIAEQIDLEPALISRFDLIFTVTDRPDPEHDRDLAEHILRTNYAGELNTQRTQLQTSNFSQEEVDSVTQEVAPEIDADLLRKYVAYAKRNCYPTMTEEAKEILRDFYVDFRSKGADEDSPVPITARKLEALVRLAEASARIRLSDTVEREDAERVTEIVEACLREIGMDPETGEFDADVVETGTSKSQRDRIKSLKGLIQDIEADYEEGAPIEEVLDRADEIGMDRSKAEAEIEKLKNKGDIYQPKQDHLRVV